MDLTRRRWQIHPYPSEADAAGLWGRGYNVSRLDRLAALPSDPLSPDNPLLLACGLLTGTAAPSGARLHLNAVSPLTGLLGSSNIGGHTGARLRACGFQGIVIRGRAPQPVYIRVEDQKAEIHDAGELWGLDTAQTQAHLQTLCRDARIKSLVIGPAGEALVRFACIVSDNDHAAGRTGMGAVMGAKNLKAIVIGRGASAPGQPAGAREAIRTYVRRIQASPDFEIFSRYGGAGYLQWADEMGLMSTRNYREKHFAAAASLDGRHLKPHVNKAGGCFRCPVQCKAELRLNPERFPGGRAFRPEFEPMINLGAKCGLEDLETLVYLDNLCTRLGLDSTSTGTTLAFAMDLFERGLLDADTAGGFSLAWGDGAAMEALIARIARREGLGDILAEGVQRAAAVIGRDADVFAAHVKGLELTAYHPGAILGTALGYAVSSRGGDYNNVYASMEHRWSRQKAAREFGTPEAVNRHSPEGKGQLVRRAVLVNVMLDCLGLCKVPTLSLLGTFDLAYEAELAAALTGRKITAPGLFEAAQRIADLERRLNRRLAGGRLQDTLPARFLKDPQTGLNAAMLTRMLQDFYAAMGWDANGRPPDA